MTVTAATKVISSPSALLLHPAYFLTPFNYENENEKTKKWYFIKFRRTSKWPT
jgi:hypothetical protein